MRIRDASGVTVILASSRRSIEQNTLACVNRQDSARGRRLSKVLADPPSEDSLPPGSASVGGTFLRALRHHASVLTLALLARGSSHRLLADTLRHPTSVRPKWRGP